MNAIVVVDQSWGIGRRGGLLFSLPTDMKRFRALTTGGTVIMGRKTLDSFPGGRPLPRRRNIVITRDESFSREGAEVVHTPEEALALCRDTDPEQLWVIGGGTIYAALLPHCTRVCVTKVGSSTEADTFFPDLDRLPGWRAEPVSEPMEENGLSFQFIDYVRE